jgi:hypothetical protein
MRDTEKQSRESKLRESEIIPEKMRERADERKRKENWSKREEKVRD